MRRTSWRSRWLGAAVPALMLGSAVLADPSHDPDAADASRASRNTPSFSTLPGTRSSQASADTARTVRMPIGKPDVRSAAVLIVDAADASVLYAKQSQRPMPIASITKLMTALVVLDGGQPFDEVLQITKADRHLDPGAASRLVVGTRLTRGELLQLALMSSENRAAQALARAYPGGVPAFVAAMNAKARALGMKSARFVDPTGLSSENVSSAADLVKLVNATAAEPVIRAFSTHQSYAVPVHKQMLEFRNTNTLVTKPDWEILVQKTGYTQAAGQCLVMQAMIQERPVVMILLNSFGKYTRVADARRIRRWMEGYGKTQMARAGR